MANSLTEHVARAIYYHMFPDRPDTWGEDNWLTERYMDCAKQAIAAYESYNKTCDHAVPRNQPCHRCEERDYGNDR